MAETKTISVKQLLVLETQLRQLDQYRFKGNVLLKLVDLGLAVQNGLKSYHAAKDKIAQEIFDSNVIDKSNPKFPEFERRVLEMLPEEREIEFETIDRNALDLDENPIPVSVLVDLSWVFVK